MLTGYNHSYYRWALHISALQGSTIKPAAKVATAATAPKAAEADFDDMFGAEEELNEDGENAEEAAATKARRERMAKAAALKVLIFLF